MARRMIRRRLTILFGVTLALVIGLVGWLVSRQMAREIFLQAERTGTAVAGSLAASASNDFFSYNYVALEQKAEEAVRDPDVVYVIFYNKEGDVAAFSGQGKPDADTVVPPFQNREFPDQSAKVTKGLLMGEGRRGLDVLVPVTLPGAPDLWGAVRMGLDLESIYRQIEQTRLFIYILGLAGVLLGWFLAAVFTRRITVPLNRLVEATLEVSEGKYDVDLDVKTGDEIQDLADNFRWMTTRIRENRDALEANLKEIGELKHFSDLVILSMTNGLMTLDEKGKIVTFNRKAEELLKIPSDLTLGNSPEVVWGNESEIGRLAREGLSIGEVLSGIEIHFLTAGEENIFEFTISPVVEADGASKGLLMLFEDLTEKKTLEEKVRRADRLAAMGTLAAGLAHEIKNPLTAVRAFVQMFPDKFQKQDFRDKFNRIVPRELDRVNELLEDLLNLVRKPRLKIQPVDTYEVIDHVLESLEPEIEKRAVKVICRGRDGMYKILADDSYLIRAIHNIVLNAVQAMPAGGDLTIEARSLSREGRKKVVEIMVKDTGPGIPEDQLADIFNPFFTSKEKGTGLGLAVTNKIIEDQGGDVRVNSERARGTVFTISLPAV